MDDLAAFIAVRFDEETILSELAAAGRYQTPKGAYYSARLRYLTADDGGEADRALADMIRAITLTVPSLTGPVSCRNCGETIVPCSRPQCVRTPAWVPSGRFASLP